MLRGAIELMACTVIATLIAIAWILFLAAAGLGSVAILVMGVFMERVE